MALNHPSGPYVISKLKSLTKCCVNLVVDFSHLIFIAILTWSYFLSNKNITLNVLCIFLKGLDIAHSDNYIFLLDLEFDNF